MAFQVMKVVARKFSSFVLSYYKSHTPEQQFYKHLYSSLIIHDLFTNIVAAYLISGNMLTTLLEHFPKVSILRNSNMLYNMISLLSICVEIYDELIYK